MLLPSLAGITISSSVVNITILPSFTCVFLALQLRRFHSSGILLTFFFFFFDVLGYSQVSHRFIKVDFNMLI